MKDYPRKKVFIFWSQIGEHPKGSGLKSNHLEDALQVAQYLCPLFSKSPDKTRDK
jgi:hypothetical protein